MWQRLLLMVGRGTIGSSDDTARLQVLTCDLLDEERRPLENFQTYGVTANPPDGLEVLAAFVGGDRSHGVVVAVGDRVYRLTGLEKGEVAIYDDLGQKVHLTRNGIVIEAPLIRVVAAGKVRFETPLLECTGEIRDRCEGDGRSMAEMRGVYNGHTHPPSGAGPSEDM
jgi:phage baseplate assembly protein V